MRTLRVGLAQINSTVGDCLGNAQKISDAIDEARGKKVDILAFPELAITGYPPEDLLLKSQFIGDNLNALETILPHCSGIAVVVGFVDQTDNIHNAAAIIYERAIRFVYHKCHLPNYGVFDEARYFHPGQCAPVFTFKDVPMGINICEDIWRPEGPTSAQTGIGGAELIINISASPYRTGVSEARETMLSARAKEHRAVIAYLNTVGGQDELVFDGGSLIVDHEGTVVARAKSFEETLLIADLSFDAVARARRANPFIKTEQSEPVLPSVKKYVLGGKNEGRRGKIVPVRVKRLTRNEEIYRALMLGLSDYLKKNRFKKAVIAISGGIDSALTEVLAVDALGPDRVIGVFMPSRYTSRESIKDVEKLSKNIGIKLLKLSIEPALKTYLDLLSGPFQGRSVDATEENLQSRIRGNIMMALSNKFGWLVLTTGNKSEMSVGYATLYGDMAGGFAVIKDVWKTTVYQLARWRNKKGGPIPTRILTRPPTAELRFHQTDQDTLPPYDVLDPILKAYIEEDRSFDEIVEIGYDPETVAQVIEWVDHSEFKRRQSPVGVKITPRALGKDWRMPITNRYRGFYQAKMSDLNHKTKRSIVANKVRKGI